MNKKLFFLILSLITVVTVKGEVLRFSHVNVRNGLGSNNVRSVVQDAKGFIWFGTTEGLYRYNGYQVSEDIMNERKTDLCKDNRIHELAVWDGRYILVRLRGRQFSMYDTHEEKFVDFTGNGSYGDQYKDFVIISKDELWLVDKDNGAKHIWKKGGNFGCKKMAKIPENITKALENRHKEKDERIQKWMQWIKERQESNTELQALSPYIYDIFYDNNNNIFIGEEDRGVTIIRRMPDVAEYLYNGTSNMDRQNIIRVVWENDNGEIQMYENRADVSAIMRDKAGHLWVGTRKNGLTINGKIYRLQIQDNTEEDNKVSGICQDRQGRTWISIFSGKIFIAQPDGKGEYNIKITHKNIPYPRKMLCDCHGQIWVASAEGVYIIDTKTMKHQNIAVGTDKVKNNEILSLYEDTKHQMWVGTTNYGLVCIDNSKIAKPVVKRVFNKANGLSNNRIETIIADNKGRIWVGTAYGLNVYNPQRDMWATYYIGPTDLSMMFYENSAIKLRDGRLAFGTKHGVAIIKPDSIDQVESLKSKVESSKSAEGIALAITDILVNGTHVERMAKDAPYQGAAWLQKEITLSHDQNTLKFYVSDFDYFSGQNTAYEFYLQGYDSDWRAPQKENFIEYTALEPGDYVLQVRAKTINGKRDGEVVTMRIKINPPLWATWWAYLIYFVVIVTILTISWRVYHRHEELKKRIKLEEQLTEYKMLFFTNVSHEFRVPLTIIRGCMEEIWQHQRMPADLKSPVVNMYKSTKRMLRLVNQLMDFSIIHDNKMKLRVEDTEIIGFARNITDAFTTMAKQRNISLEFSTTEKKLQMPVDQNCIDKILYNLIGNAFKYTQDGGSVKVSIITPSTFTSSAQNCRDGEILIKVADTGIGISKEKQKELFSRFDQSASISDSIGIGLHLSKMMAERHHGTLTYSQNSPKGSIFTLSLSTLTEDYRQDEWMAHEAPSTNEVALSTSQNREGKGGAIPQEYLEMETPPFNDKTILIVEDDMDVQQYIKKTLSKHFRVVTAANGKDAVEMFNDDIALVITDSMMPLMNGTQLIKHIREGNINSQVPVIMITALTSEMEQVKAYKVGVNIFVQKPFSPKILLTQALSVIQGEMDKEQSFKNSLPEGEGRSGEPTIVVDAQDKRFRTLFDKWIDEHISDRDLGVEKMAEGLKLGRTILFKRVKDITGKTPNEYIRTKRIEHAQQCLADDSLTIQQVAIKVGFEDQFYFSKVFKSVTGMTPSQYRKTGGKL